MRRLGKAMHLRGARRLVIKASFAPRISDIVYDDRMRPVGRVYDVFGPVDSPYVSVLLNPELGEREAEALVGRYFFVKSPFRRRAKGRRG